MSSTAKKVERSLILVRHAATAFTQEGRFQGLRDETLCAEGREQARLLGARLRHEWLNDVDGVRIWSSDLRRAHETATLTFGEIGITTDIRLRELALGRFEGLTKTEIHSREPDVPLDWLSRPEVSGGESLDQLRGRLLQWLDDVEIQPIVLAVTHGFALRMLLSITTGESFDSIRKIPIPPGTAVRIDGERKAVAINDLEWLAS